MKHDDRHHSAARSFLTSLFVEFAKGLFWGCGAALSATLILTAHPKPQPFDGEIECPAAN